MTQLLYAALLLSVVALSEACSCLERHPQEVYCGSHIGKLLKGLSYVTIFEVSFTMYN